MKTLIANKDYILLDNEIYFLGEKSKVDMGNYVYDPENGVRRISTFHPDMVNTKFADSQQVTHTTATLPYAAVSFVKQLDRSLFVKGVDLNVMSREAMFKQTLVSGSSFYTGFESGYNANKKVFTMEEAQYLFRLGIGDYTFHEAVKVIRPLSLPSSITINGDDITINW